MLGPLTYLDAALVAIALLSGLLAMYRGLTREVLSILSWIVAAGAVAYFVFTQKAVAEDIAQQIGAPVQIAQVVVGGLLFLIVLVVVHLITSKISDTILDSNIGMIDRILGFVFGVARGFILIVIPFMLYENFFPEPQQQFPWVREAKSLPYIKSTGESLRSMLAQYVPEKLLNPDSDGQQSWRITPPVQHLALEKQRRVHISVTRTAGRSAKPLHL